MRIVVGLVLAIIIASAQSAQVSAFDEQIGDVAVPHDVSMSVQGMWQGYIIYSVQTQDDGYAAVIARDDEPHQFPVRYVFFDKQWKLIRDTGYQSITPPRVEQPKVQPETPEKAAPQPEAPKPEAPKPEEKPVEPEPQKPDQTPIVPPKPDKPPKPEPPVVKPPDPEPTPPPKPEPTPTTP